MKELYAKILANHAADVIGRTSSLTPTGITVTDHADAQPLCELAVKIDFKGLLNGQQEVTGYVSCGCIEMESLRALLIGMADHLKLGKDLMASKDGPANLISEFLNIVVGLTGADWSTHGFEIDFGIPSNISCQAPQPFKGQETAFSIDIGLDNQAKVNLFAVFSV